MSDANTHAAVVTASTRLRSSSRRLRASPARRNRHDGRRLQLHSGWPETGWKSISFGRTRAGPVQAAGCSPGTPGCGAEPPRNVRGWRYNRYYPIVRFGVRMQTDGVAVTIKQAVRPDVLRRLAPGAIVNVRVTSSDRRRVVIDWSDLIPDSAAID